MNINKSKSYLLPLLNTEINLKWINNLKNTYLFIEEYDDPIIGLLYKFDSEYTYFKNKVQGFIIYEEYLMHHKLFIDKIDVGDDVLFILQFPDKYLHEYNMYLEGKYSLFRKNSKKLIMEFLTDQYKGTKEYAIVNYVEEVLNKGKAVRSYIEERLAMTLPENSELSSKINIKSETFKTVIGNE